LPEPDRRASRSSSSAVDGENDDARIVPNGERVAVVALLMIANAGPLHAGDQLLVHHYDGEG
jgi:hypothetical protein